MADDRLQISKAKEPKGKAVAISFEGPMPSVHSTRAARLGHSELFTTGRAEMWWNVAVFNAKAGSTCGLFLHEFAKGRGRLILLFPDDHSSAETRFHFEEFVLAQSRQGLARIAQRFQRWEPRAARRRVPSGTAETIWQNLLVSPNNRNNWECALAEAAYMTGLERNGDVVVMSASDFLTPGN